MLWLQIALDTVQLIGPASWEAQFTLALELVLNLLLLLFHDFHLLIVVRLQKDGELDCQANYGQQYEPAKCRRYTPEVHFIEKAVLRCGHH